MFDVPSPIVTDYQTEINRPLIEKAGKNKGQDDHCPVLIDQRKNDIISFGDQSPGNISKGEHRIHTSERKGGYHAEYLQDQFTLQ